MLFEPYSEDKERLPFEEYESYISKCKCDPDACMCMSWDDFVCEWVKDQQDSNIDDTDYEDFA